MSADAEAEAEAEAESVAVANTDSNADSSAEAEEEASSCLANHLPSRPWPRRSIAAGAGSAAAGTASKGKRRAEEAGKRMVVAIPSFEVDGEK